MCENIQWFFHAYGYCYSAKRIRDTNRWKKLFEAWENSAKVLKGEYSVLEKYLMLKYRSSCTEGEMSEFPQ